ncbi:hypothetical protein LMG24235_08384 [Paraburkholderia sabiae]|uniref:Uncharacterized protein n=1 Tax=Paraburkholderia sabiae TaxID=273251 RepID=A0ABU9QQX8_9BURK|nr:hypothetical protein [Paraburkholderia sabiae]CAD6563142.1 hypothetical protein LMG24235_08384 [Paraburkholderia sabiae]
MSPLAAPVAHTGTVLIVDDTPANLGMVVDKSRSARHPRAGRA